MSQKERKDGKLDLRPLYGVAVSVGLLTAGLAWVLTRHKNKSREERLVELDHRNEVRCGELARKILNLQGEKWEAATPQERETLKLLIKEAREFRALLKAEALLSPKERLHLEELREAEAEIDDQLCRLEDPSYE